MPDPIIQIRSLISENLFPLEDDFCDEMDLYMEGLDSMGLMQLILLLEQEFGVGLTPEDLGRENFQSLRAIRDLILQKQEE